MDSSSKKVKKTSIHSLSEDLLFTILTYLPLNSIFKFRTVSTLWFSLLTDPNFMTKWFHFNFNNTIHNKSLPWIQIHNVFNQRTSDDPLRFVYKIAYSDSRFQPGFLKKNPFGGRLHLIGSSNGLLLCSSVNSSNEMTTNYYVCNPLTAKWVSIPSPPRPQAPGFGVTGVFCENSSCSTSCFQIVHVPRIETPTKEFEVEIFSSDLGEWVCCKASCSQDIKNQFPLFNNVITHNGVMYWMEGRNKLLVYDLSNNVTGGGECSLIYLPDEGFYDLIEAPNPIFDYRSQYLGESEGLICYARLSRNQTTLTVWMLKEEKWQVVHDDVELQDVLAKMESLRSGAIQVMGFSPVDRNVVLLGCNNYVWEFNMKTKRSEELSYLSFSADTHSHGGNMMLMPFVLKPMPTILPPPFWIGT